MKKINTFQFSFAFGITGSLLYIVSILLVLMMTDHGYTGFINLLFHGFDVSSIFSPHPPFASDLFGILLFFVLFFLFVAIRTGIYNSTLKDG